MRSLQARAAGGCPLANCYLANPAVVEAGPDENFERLRWVIIGALHAAQHSVLIITPYFLPDTGIISKLHTAAMRGIQIDILLPERSNLP